MKFYYRPFTCPSDLVPFGEVVPSPTIHLGGSSEPIGYSSARSTQSHEASFTIKWKEES